MAESFEEEEWDDFASFDTLTAPVSSVGGSAEATSSKSDPNLQPPVVQPQNAFDSAFDDHALDQGLSLSYSQTVDSPTGGLSVEILTPNSAFISDASPLSAFDSAHTSQRIEVNNTSSTAVPLVEGEDEWDDFAGPVGDTPAPTVPDVVSNVAPEPLEIDQHQMSVENPEPIDSLVKEPFVGAESEVVIESIKSPSELAFTAPENVIAPEVVAEDEWDDFESHSPAPVPASLATEAAVNSISFDVTTTADSITTEAAVPASSAVIEPTQSVAIEEPSQVEVTPMTAPTAVSVDNTVPSVYVEEPISATTAPCEPVLVGLVPSISPTMQLSTEDPNDPFADISFDQPTASPWTPAPAPIVELPVAAEDVALADSPSMEPTFNIESANVITSPPAVTEEPLTEVAVSAADVSLGENSDVNNIATESVAQEEADPFAELSAELPISASPLSLPVESLDAPSMTFISYPTPSPAPASVVEVEIEVEDEVKTEKSEAVAELEEFPVTPTAIVSDERHMDQSSLANDVAVVQTLEASDVMAAQSTSDAVEDVLENTVADAVDAIASVAVEEVKENKEAEQEAETEDPFAALAAAEGSVPAAITADATAESTMSVIEAPVAAPSDVVDGRSEAPVDAVEVPLVEESAAPPADAEKEADTSVSAEVNFASEAAVESTTSSIADAVSPTEVTAPIAEVPIVAIVEEEDPFDSLLTSAPLTASIEVSATVSTPLPEPDAITGPVSIEVTSVEEPAAGIAQAAGANDVGGTAGADAGAEEEGFGDFEDAAEVKIEEKETEGKGADGVTIDFDALEPAAPVPGLSEPSFELEAPATMVTSTEEEEDPFGDISFQQADGPVSSAADPGTKNNLVVDVPVIIDAALTEKSHEIVTQVVESPSGLDSPDREAQVQVELSEVEKVEEVVQETVVEEEDEWDDFEGPVLTPVSTSNVVDTTASEEVPAFAPAASAVTDVVLSNEIAIDETEDLTYSSVAPVATADKDVTAMNDAALSVAQLEVTPFEQDIVFGTNAAVEVNEEEEEEEEWDAFEGPAAAVVAPPTGVPADTPASVSDTSTFTAAAAATAQASPSGTDFTFAAFGNSAESSAAAGNSFEASFDDNTDTFGSASGANDDDEWAAFEDHSSANVNAFTDSNSNMAVNSADGADSGGFGSFEANFDAPSVTISHGAVAGGFGAFDEAPPTFSTPSVQDSQVPTNSSFAAFGSADSFPTAKVTTTSAAAVTAAKAIPASTNSADFYSPATLQVLNASVADPATSGLSDMTFIAALPGLQFTEDQRKAYDAVSSLSANLFATATPTNNKGGGVLSALANSNSLQQPLGQFDVDLASIIAPATSITATEAPAVRLEATLQTMVAESVPADALSLEQLALMLEALELKSAGGKKQAASAAAAPSSSAAQSNKPPLASRSTSSSGDRKRQGSDASSYVKPTVTGAASSASEQSAGSSSPLDYLFGRKSVTATATAAATGGATSATNSSKGNVSPTPAASSPVQRKSSFLSLTAAISAATSTATATNNSTTATGQNNGAGSGVGPSSGANGKANSAGPSATSTTANTASGSPPAIVARLAKERSLDEGYFGDNTSNLNLSPTALDFINSLPDLAYLLH